MGMDKNVLLVLGFAILVFVVGEIPLALAADGPIKGSPSSIPKPAPSAKIDAQPKNAIGSNTADSHLKAKSDTNLTDANKANSTSPKGPSLDDSQSLPPPSQDSKEGNNQKDATKNAAGPTNDIGLNASPKKEQEDGVCKVQCKDEGNLTACLLDSVSASNELIILVENQGEATLKVNINVLVDAKTKNQELNLSRHSHEKINALVHAGETPRIILNAGHGNCTLQLQQAPASVGAPALTLFFFRLPSYATYATPIYGAYLFFLAVLITGGTWACCKFGRRSRRDGSGVPYQELEMGLPESSSAVRMDSASADGWDQGWDDDWEEQKAVSRTQEIRRAGNVSANGLTSRSGNKEGWDDDWDD